MLTVVALPLAAGLVYVVGALFIKQALSTRVGASTMALIANVALAIGFAPLWLASSAPLLPQPLWPVVVYGALVATGNWLVFIALKHGDVSVATPVLGSKVVVVAILVSALLGQRLAIGTWIGVALCMIALVLLQRGALHAGERRGLTLVLSLAASVSFALSDILVQHWSPRMGFAGFMFPALVAGALMSVVTLPGAIANRDAVRVAWRPTLLGATFNVGQGMLLTLSIALHHDATTTNVLYGLRGVWSLVLVVTLGRAFRNTERQLGLGTLGARLSGALLMLCAVAVSLAAK